MERRVFEFGAAENEIIRVLAGRMNFVGTFYIVVGVLMGTAGIVTVVTSLPSTGMVYLVMTVPQFLIGAWTMQAAISFRMIAKTSGNDIKHLVTALESLRKLYNLQFWILIIVIALVVVFLIFMSLGVL